MRPIATCMLVAALVAGCDSPTDTTAPAQLNARAATVTSNADDPGIDRSRLQPQLFPGLDWTCRWVFNQRQIFCRAAPARNFDFTPTFEPDFPCPNGQPVYRQGGRSLIAKRYYNSDYKLVERILYWYNQRLRYSLHPDGSAPTASTIGESMLETNDLVVPGGDPTQEAVTTLEGTDVEIRLDAPGHRLLARDKGKIRIDPSGAFTIIFGRWDFFTDPDRAFRRVCSALRGPRETSTMNPDPAVKTNSHAQWKARRPNALP